MTFPGQYDGQWPIDTTSDVGKFRYALGDTQGEEYVPPVAGHRNFEVYSDEEIRVLLEMADGSFSTAIGYAYLKLAGIAAGQAIDWRSDDLSVTLSKTPAALKDIAAMWFDRGSIEGSADGFFIVDTGRGNSCGHDPELAPGTVCGTTYCGCWRW